MSDNDSEAMGMVEQLSALVAEIADDLEGVSATTVGGVVEYQRGGSVFARATSEGLEVRLPPDIVEAANRTPDTTPIDGDPDWLRFTPTSDEQHALDRAQAWIVTAWRHAA